MSEGMYDRLRSIFNRKSKPASNAPTVELKEIEKPKTPEVIKIGIPLPPEYQKPLDNLKGDLPSNFKSDAKKAAYYMWSLDESKKLQDENGKNLDEERQLFVDQLTWSGFVTYTYNKLSSRKNDPEKALPRWIIENAKAKPLPRGVNENEKVLVGKWYDEYVLEQQAEKVISEDNQEYFKFHQGILLPDNSLLGNFKCYIDESNLLNFDALNRCLAELRERNIHPTSSKLFERENLVLYWNSKQEDEVSKEIRSIFAKYNVDMRGPAQDPSQIVIDEDGRALTQVRTSNDASLGDSFNPFLWDGDIYNTEEFFKQYLRLTFYGCKNPSEPYLASFVPVHVENPEKSSDLVGKITRKIAKRDELEVYVAPNSSKHLEAFK